MCKSEGEKGGGAHMLKRTEDIHYRPKELPEGRYSKRPPSTKSSCTNCIRFMSMKRL